MGLVRKIARLPAKWATPSFSLPPPPDVLEGLTLRGVVVSAPGVGYHVCHDETLALHRFLQFRLKKKNECVQNTIPALTQNKTCSRIPEDERFRTGRICQGKASERPFHWLFCSKRNSFPVTLIGCFTHHF